MTKSLTEKIVHIQYELDELFDEYKKIQEQLKDANEVIKYYATADLSDWEYIDGEEVFVEKGAANETETAENYINKWGVK